MVYFRLKPVLQAGAVQQIPVVQANTLGIVFLQHDPGGGMQDFDVDTLDSWG
jgi:hypothetical protein